MSFLIESIIDEFEQGTSTEAVYLRRLLATGSMAADFDLTDAPEPYVVVAEGETVATDVTANYTVRIEETPVTFKVFARARQEASEIAEAIDNLYQTTLLSVEERDVLERPRFESRTPIWKVDNWQCEIKFAWTMQKRFN